ncbi:MAG: cation-translocating P-type ATPase, partial [Pusillimonas sp.]|nr:cation-translocating P-type ATPase [Pusillimonas sp.]
MKSSHISLSVQGMTCASCVGRVERALRKLPGVEQANVNLATERAEIDTTDALLPQQAIQAIQKAGYEASVITEGEDDHLADRQQAEVRHLQLQLWVAALLTLPVFILEMGAHMVPAFHHWVQYTIGTQNSWYFQFVLTTAYCPEAC